MSKVGFDFRMEIEEGDRNLIVVAQNQSIRTNLVNAKIDESQKDMLYRLCKKADESVDHAVSGSSQLAQKEYKGRYDNLSKIVHWKLAR